MSRTENDLPLDAWNAFADELKAQGVRVMQALPERLRRDPQTQQEAWRLTLGALAARTIDALAADGDHPVFLPWANVTMSPNQPNDDTTYRKAIITPGGTYRLRGERGTLCIFKMFQLKLPIEETGLIECGMGFLGFNDFADLKVDAEGRFDVILSPERPAGYAGDWWQLNPEATALWLRQVAFDWATERDPRFSIERLDVPAARPRQSAAELEQRLRGLAVRVGNTAAYMIDHVERLRDEGCINRFKEWETQAGGKKLAELAGFIGQFYYEGAFEIAADEALIIESQVPEQCRYWSMLLTNDIYESIDWYNNQTCLNGTQMRVDADGMVRVVVSLKDPGVPNWLDTAGHLSGAIQGRWTDSSAVPMPAVHRVPLAKVREHLPAETPVVSAEERERVLRERRAQVQLRPLW